MIYKSIILCKYKRLALNHIDYIELTPEQKIQLILGTNGSGKSSLLSQITPLPANHQDYHKDGYKIIEILHNNSHYLLKNLFGQTGNKFHFIKDGVELNDGLTASTYRELVKQEFNITQDVHDLITGATLFHEMSVSERRNWFTKISSADYTYALQYFAKLKEQHRDMVGAIKMQQSRLVQESEKLLTPEQEEKCRNEISILTETLHSFLEMKSPVKTTGQEIVRNIQSQDNELSMLSSELMRYRASFLKNGKISSIEEIDAALIETQAIILSCESQIAKLAVDIESQDKILESVRNSNLDDIGNIDQTVDKLMTESMSLKTQLRMPFEIPQAQQAFSALLSVLDQLHHVSSELEENRDRKYSRDSYTALLSNQTRLEQLLLRAQSSQTNLTAQKKELEHFKEHNRLECPNCSHVWFKGYDETKYRIVCSDLSNIESTIEKIKLEKSENDELLRKTVAYLEQYRNYVTISRSLPVLNPLWDHLLQSDLIFNEPKQLPRLLETLKLDLQISMKSEDVNKRLDEALKLRETLSKSQETSVSSIVEHSNRLHAELHVCNAKLQSSRNAHRLLTQSKQSIVETARIQERIEELLSQRDALTADLTEAAKRSALNEAIQMVQLELTQREQMVSKIDVQKALIANIEAQVKDMTEKSEVLKIAITELSPSHGLIAKGLTGFINHYIAQMNNFIKKIWLYPMELLLVTPTDDDDFELDYKFSVRVNDNQPIPDVAKGSAGMREIFNLAFKIVSMQYLGLDKAPLTMDEFGANLDMAHRQSAHYAIANLLTNSNFSQIFMVSHYESSYGSLKNSDITVLCPSNIGLPKDAVFNKVCKMA